MVQHTRYLVMRAGRSLQNEGRIPLDRREEEEEEEGGGRDKSCLSWIHACANIVSLSAASDVVVWRYIQISNQYAENVCGYPGNVLAMNHIFLCDNSDPRVWIRKSP